MRSAIAADRAHLALMGASANTPPPCTGDPLYTAETIALEQQRRMRSLCMSCPVLDQCRAYARAGRPEAGYWAGKLRGTSPAINDKGTE